MERALQTEWLDELPETDVQAMWSRRDLQRINSWMGNVEIVAAHWPKISVRRIAELGAGDGTFLQKVAKQVARSGEEVETILVDRNAHPSNATADGFARLGWHVRQRQADVFQWLEEETGEIDVIVANLFLHHFEGDALRRLLAGVAQRARYFIACEPERRWMGLAGVKLLPLIGCNHVTQHDARISVQAGFAGEELSQMWPWEKGWKLEERSIRLFSHLFVAERSA